jgi:hypothetical protein
MQQITPRRTVDVNINTRCITTAKGFSSRKHPGFFEVKSMRLDVHVQVITPSGWRRQATAGAVRWLAVQAVLTLVYSCPSFRTFA